MSIIKKILILGLLILGVVLWELTHIDVKVTTVSDYPQTFNMRCDDCDNVTDSIIMREALTYDKNSFVDSVPPNYILDKAYYEKIPNTPYWRVVVYQRVKIDE